MKITPLEIRQQTFEKELRGYDKDEVNGFLQTLSQEWERTQDESKELRVKFEAAEREVAKLREVESSLFRTLKTAEDTGSNLIDQANKSAELLLRESHLKCEGMVNEAKAKAKNTIEEAEVITRRLLEEMEEQLKSLVQQYKTLEQHRDNLLSDLKRLAGETIDRVERMKGAGKEFNPDQHLVTAKRTARKALFPNEFEGTRRTTTPEPAMVEEKTNFAEDKAPKSFFDDIQ